MAWVIGIAVFFLLLFVFPRYALSIVLVIAAGVVGVHISEQIERQKRAEILAKFIITISYGGEKCSGSHPLFIRFFNGSDQTVTNAEFSVLGYRNGAGNPAMSSRFSAYKSDRIIPSNEGWANCWTLPTPILGGSVFSPETLDWKAENLFLRFEKS